MGITKFSAYIQEWPDVNIALRLDVQTDHAGLCSGYLLISINTQVCRSTF